MNGKICFNCKNEIGNDFAFCPNCGTNLKTEIICKDCNYPNEPNSKFCQECGTNLLGEKKKTITKSLSPTEIITIPEPIHSGIVIEFPFNTSQSFDFAVNEAKLFETFEQFGTDKKAVYRISISENELDKLSPLLEQMKGWRKRTVNYNGEKVQWDTVFSYTWCYTRKQSSYKPELYCFGYENTYEFNIWGCLRTNLPFAEQSPLFRFGKWVNNKGDWEFDKDRIKHELLKNVYGCRFCPAINMEHINDIIDSLPTVVNPQKNNKWKFVESYSEETNALVIKPTSQFGLTKYLVGACPNGKEFINDIAESIKNRIPEFVRK